MQARSHGDRHSVLFLPFSRVEILSILTHSIIMDFPLNHFLNLLLSFSESQAASRNHNQSLQRLLENKLSIINLTMSTLVSFFLAFQTVKQVTLLLFSPSDSVFVKIFNGIR